MVNFVAFKTHLSPPNSGARLIIGNFGLSYEQSKTQMALWFVTFAGSADSLGWQAVVVGTRPAHTPVLL